MIYKNWFSILLGLMTLAAAASTFFLYQKVNDLSEKQETESSSSYKAVNKSSAEADKDTRVFELNVLKQQLDAAEKEMDIAYEKLSELLEKSTSGAPLEEAEKILKKRKIKLDVDRDYAMLRKRLELAPETLDDFKRIENEWRLADDGTILGPISNPEDYEKADKLKKENKEKYSRKLKELSGEEKYLIYDTFKSGTGERWEVNTFMESTPPENRISYDTAGDLIFAMNDARKATEEEMGLEDVNNSSASNEDKDIRRYEIGIQGYRNYEQAVRDILPPEQAELLNAQLRKNRESFEGTLKYLIAVRDKNKKKGDESAHN